MVVKFKDKIRNWYLMRHMDHLTDSIAEPCQSMYIYRDDVPVDDMPWKKCEPKIVFESLDLSVCR